MSADAARVLQDLRRVGVFFLRHVADLLEQRQVNVGFDIALRPGVSVPVPRAAEISGFLDNADLLDAGFLQAGGRKQATKTAADDDGVDGFLHRFAHDGRCNVGIDVVALKVSSHLAVLVVAFRTQALVALFGIATSQFARIEAEFFAGGQSERWCFAAHDVVLPRSTWF